MSQPRCKSSCAKLPVKWSWLLLSSRPPLALLLCHMPSGAPNSSKQWQASCSCGPSPTAHSTAGLTHSCMLSGGSNRLAELPPAMHLCCKSNFLMCIKHSKDDENEMCVCVINMKLGTAAAKQTSSCTTRCLSSFS